MPDIVLVDWVDIPIVGDGDDGIAADEGSVGDPSVKLSLSRAADPYTA
jgi:hypothetical protein